LKKFKYIFILVQLIWSTHQVLIGQHTYSPNNLKLFESFFYPDQSQHVESLKSISEQWIPGYAVFIPEIVHYTDNGIVNLQLLQLLEKKTGQTFGREYFSWMNWLWQSDALYPYYYFDFKAGFYKLIDPKFEKYFAGRYDQATIRLDEVLWGGVKQDGIPPLRYPKMISAKKAVYLDDKDIVFGVQVGGVARAYPKRILGWHEMVIDQLDQKDIVGVYCTLCGTMIAYDLDHEGEKHELGTSGFLYRSNKLMYDKKTQSLWSTIDGAPVIGPLVGKGIQLKTYSVNTTTWGDWKSLYPDTKVLSLETGHKRDYAEGAAYKSYYETDDLMFPVAEQNPALLNKDEVLIVRSTDYQSDPLAISVDFLKRKNIYQDKIGSENIVILTEKNGISRAFHAGRHHFKKYKNSELIDDQDKVWSIIEDSLRSRNGDVLNRVPAHRIFWFAWYASYPKTRLVK
jgi:hypothetical protein